jgi:hypothetical protein
VKLVIIFIIFFSFSIYSWDDGTSEVEYSFGEVVFVNDNKINNEYFLYLSHNYLYYLGKYYFSFKSQLGISKNLLFQESSDLSYKNILTGIIPGVKYKYLPGFNDIIPEISLGITLDIISLWNENNENNLIFFTGINIGLGISYNISEIFRLGVKFMYDIGYSNFMNKKRERFLSNIITLVVSFDFYEN